MWIHDVADQYNLEVKDGRHNNIDGIAVFDELLTKRYILEKRWRDGEKVFLAFMMNPSKAAHNKSDATVNQMIRLAKVYDCDALQVINVSSFIEGLSNDVPDESFTFDTINWAFIERALIDAYIIFISWGIQGQQGINNWLLSQNIVANTLYNVRLKCYAYEHLLALKEKIYYVPHPRPRGTVRKYEDSLAHKLSLSELVDLFWSD
ncbi:DUF1643 domain-containing protein [Lysinibacillus sp. FSL R7-0073]|uniref:DUF1643 domain-containing protein n=1 Tax=Lysinibacillus fusiformis TaxID=28031 RepID=A0A1E4R8B7_9BACI|nr:DUF1643 domain-containing protein [Lysinibacillus fusiformis]MCR8853487.1 DUF1643 domain-containing protein [Lysinibacillus fusiformis]ODV56726.1 hypothetical protein BG258_12905 [Lysinibacillus fusiformis]